MDTEVDALRGGAEETPVKPLRIGIIGCGGIAQTHINYLTKYPGVSIVAGADINPAALDRMRDKHGCPCDLVHHWWNGFRTERRRLDHFVLKRRV